MKRMGGFVLLYGAYLSTSHDHTSGVLEYSSNRGDAFSGTDRGGGYLSGRDRSSVSVYPNADGDADGDRWMRRRGVGDARVVTLRRPTTTTTTTTTMSTHVMTMKTAAPARAAVRSNAASRGVRPARGARAVARATERVDGGIYKEPAQGFTEQIIEEVLADFPEEGIADVLEGMILVLAGGYRILDVRAKSEIEFVGNYPRDQVNGPRFIECPIINATRQYDSEKGEKVYKQTINADFKAQVEKLFPDKEAKILVACSDGRNRTLQALEFLDEMGYVNIVGLRGGYNMWNRQWDAKLRRRNLPGVFKEEYGHSADGCGVHATGASFQNQDAFQYADWRDDTEWLDAHAAATVA